jgi:UDP-N-acetylmuramyl pentapeptide phosphotransferase/UDP-N-acetylglucosamine-1-phosphate transferase
MHENVIIIFLSFALSVFCSAFIYRFGNKLSLIDKPGERSSHSTPTPRGGGFGIWLSFVLIGFFIVKSIYFTTIAGIAGLVGLIEDRFNLSSKVRLVVQLALSFSVVIIFTGSPTSVSETALFILYIIFITGTANFYNFMDGINGIAGLTGVVGFGLMAFFSFFIDRQPDTALLSIVLASACLGFLPFNFPQAKVFMGDVGSIFLGFVFASFVVKLSTTLNVFLCLIMFLCTFYADATVTIFYRWRKGENLMKAHRRHLYQYLSNELRLPHWKVTVVYSITQLMFGTLALLSFKKGLTYQLVIFGIFAIMFLVAYKVVKNIRRYETTDV